VGKLAHEESMNGSKSDRLKILKLFGTIDFDPTYDYKAERMRRPKDHAREPSDDLRTEDRPSGREI
jgi:hypothetical protein